MTFDTDLIGKRISFILEYRGEFTPFVGQVKNSGHIRTDRVGPAFGEAEIARMCFSDVPHVARTFPIPLEVFSRLARVTVEQLEAVELGDSGIAESYVPEGLVAA